jgi:sugar phosphate isomerase/epimerase
MPSKILLGTVLLEPHRWVNRTVPLVRASEWAARAAAAGFDGLELWENHWFRAEPAERAALLAAPLPASVFNAYARFDQAAEEAALGEAITAASQLRASSLKFNVGPAPGDAARLAASLSRFAGTGVRPRCECHAGTWLETPESAAAFHAGSGAEPFDVIVHAFSLSPEELSRWFSLLGPRITGVHVQCRDEQGGWSGIARHAARSRQALKVLAEQGFSGDFTLEFTAGTAAEGNDPEALWLAALEDLGFLKTELPRASVQ